ncbi:MAG: pseudouridine synthase [Candidatus Magasanikbacteria bacterium]|nr:pseudouridine synthase [Candidatus Magasanikbacteria bacterium]
MRLQKYIANLGFCSRRRAEELIKLGKIKVNGRIAEIGMKINPEEDEVGIENQILNTDTDKIYIAVNKPVGYVTSTSSKQGKSVIDLLDKSKIKRRVYPVGRLDKDSEGLVLLTNDGELTNRLTHPKYEHEKEYEIELDKTLSNKDKKTLESGMDIGEKVRGIKIKKTDNPKKYRLVLQEGKNRQIRKMLGRLGYNLQSLKRLRLGKLKLNKLPTGKWKFVEKKEII